MKKKGKNKPNQRRIWNKYNDRAGRGKKHNNKQYVEKDHDYRQSLKHEK